MMKLLVVAGVLSAPLTFAQNISDLNALIAGAIEVKEEKCVTSSARDGVRRNVDSYESKKYILLKTTSGNDTITQSISISGTEQNGSLSVTFSKKVESLGANNEVSIQTSGTRWTKDYYGSWTVKDFANSSRTSVLTDGRVREESTFDVEGKAQKTIYLWKDTQFNSLELMTHGELIDSTIASDDLTQHTDCYVRRTVKQ